MQGHSEPNRELLDAAALCRKLVPEGSVEAFLADHRQELFPDEMFADLFPSGRGRPSVPADVIATVIVLQSLEGLSDRDAARALRDRISWKVACGLALDDPGFHHTVLTYWRGRLRASDRPERIFEAVRAVVEATGVLKGRPRRALDSTLLDDAVATQDTVTQLISAIRRVLREIPAAATVQLTGHDYDAGAKPVIAWDDPVAKQALVSALVADAHAVIQAAGGAELTPEQRDAVGLLALVAGQDVEPGEEEGTWRIAQRVAPDRVISTVDPDARHMHKSRSHYRDGYKAHLAVEPETGIITAATLTPANAADGPAGVALLEKEREGLEVLADSAYGSGEVRAAAGW
jgi:IS5 family transposase